MLFEACMEDSLCSISLGKLDKGLSDKERFALDGQREYSKWILDVEKNP